MDNKRLSRILTEKLAPYTYLPYWQVRTTVDKAIEEALGLSYGVDRLLDDLRKRVVRFSYRKRDGSIREAIGTLKESLLAEIVSSRKTKRANHSECIVYFDLERDDWRCFCPENFIAPL